MKADLELQQGNFRLAARGWSAVILCILLGGAVATILVSAGPIALGAIYKFVGAGRQ